MIDWMKLAAGLSEVGLVAATEYPLATHTTYAVGGSARLAVRVTSKSDAQSVAKVLQDSPDIEIVVVGRGSNILVSDNGCDALVVIMNSQNPENSITIYEEFVMAPAGLTLPVLARRSSARARTGLEWAVGVPGSVGGGIRMNAGGHGSDMADSLVSADIVSLRTGVCASVERQDLGLHFRGSALMPHHVVVSGTFVTQLDTQGRSQQILNDVVSWRRQHQPGGRNAGSVFVNPGVDAQSAGSLIDQCGLRGFTIGGAMVSDKHANFIQATDGTRAADIVEVMIHVQDVVEKSHGIRLRSEVHLVGFGTDIVARFSDPKHSDPERQTARVRLEKAIEERGQKNE